MHSSRQPIIYPPQVLTGRKPFYDKPHPTYIPAVLEGVRPDKPLHAQTLGLSDTLWELLELCWSRVRSSRPTAGKLLDYLSHVSPNWVPPAEYPVIVTEASSTSSTDWFGSSQGEKLTSEV